MSDKDFKVKNKLQVKGITTAGPITADASGNIDSVPYIATQYGGTGITTSPNAGQVLYSPSGATYTPTTLNTLDVKGATYSADAPSSPVVGQIWVESDTSSDSFDPNIIRRKTFTATAAQTVFTTDLEFIQGYEQVFFNGMLLIRNSDYTTASNTNVTLTAGAAAGDIVEIVSITNLNSINTATTTTNTFTGNQIVNARIGISTSSPDAKLTVQESGDAQVTLKNSSGVTKAFIGTAGIVGGASTDDLRIRSDASNMIFAFSGFEKMRLDSSGRIGLGQTSTGALMHIYGAGGWSSFNYGKQLYITTPTSSSNPAIGISDSTGSNNWAIVNSAGTLVFAGAPAITDSSTPPNPRIYFDASGNIGIGSPSLNSNTRLYLYNSDVSNPVQSVLHNANAGGSRYLLLSSGGGNAGSLAWDNNNAKLSLDTLGAYPILFRTNNTTGATLDTSQYLLVGYGTSNGAYRLQVNSQIFATSSSIATSDGRYKENVDTITSGLSIVDSLRPVSFTWKDHPVHNFVTGKTVGFIAQEVQEALSEYEWVDNIIKSNYNEETEEEFLGIAEANIIPLLVAAVKELKARVETLEAN